MHCNLHDLCSRYVIVTDILNIVLKSTMVYKFLFRRKSCTYRHFEHFVHSDQLPFELLVGWLHTSLSSMRSKIQWIFRLAEIRWPQKTVLLVNVN